MKMETGTGMNKTG